MTPEQYSLAIFEAATPVLEITELGGKRWIRNVASGARIGPWLRGRYRVLNEEAWRRREPSLYLVADTPNHIRYVGISRNRVADRWRVSPALDADTRERLPEDQIFHSQCWKHIERAAIDANGAFRVEVRAIASSQLIPLLEKLGPPLSGLLVLASDGESVVAAVERWMCNNQSTRLASWNTAMTGANRVAPSEPGTSKSRKEAGSQVVPGCNSASVEASGPPNPRRGRCTFS